jgi:hypothetical protein
MFGISFIITNLSIQSFPRLVLPSGQKLTLGLLATITLEVDPFLVYAQFPALLPFLKCILEVMFCEVF